MRVRFYDYCGSNLAVPYFVQPESDSIVAVCPNARCRKQCGANEAITTNDKLYCPDCGVRLLVRLFKPGCNKEIKDCRL